MQSFIGTCAIMPPRTQPQRTPAAPPGRLQVTGPQDHVCRLTGDWAVMSWDGVQALRQGAEKAGSIAPEAIKDALRGLTIETARGSLAFREIDNQLAASAYVGRIADDPKFDFPVYADLVEYKAPDIWRPEADIHAARKKVGQ